MLCSPQKSQRKFVAHKNTFEHLCVLRDECLSFAVVSAFRRTYETVTVVPVSGAPATVGGRTKAVMTALTSIKAAIVKSAS